MKAGSLAFEGGRPLSINLNPTSPVLAALQDLNNAGQPSGEAGLIGGQGSPGASNAGAVTVGQNGSLDLNAVGADAMSLSRATSVADLAVGAGQSVAGLL